MCTKLEHVKKIDWCRDRRQGDGLVIAAGSRSGRVSLVSFPNVKQAVDDDEDDEDPGGGGGNDDDDDQVEDEDPLGSNSLERRSKLPEPPTPYLGNVTKIFLPKHRRACVSLRWNPIKIYQVASGHEKQGRTTGA